jgi:hypothetical protein
MNNYTIIEYRKEQTTYYYYTKLILKDAKVYENLFFNYSAIEAWTDSIFLE